MYSPFTRPRPLPAPALSGGAHRGEADRKEFPIYLPRSGRMAPRKRARAAASPSSSSSAAAPKITLRGGEAHHSSLAALWREEKLTDIAVCAEGVEFKAHRAALASSSG